MRRALASQSCAGTISRLSDHDVIENLTHAISRGRLRICAGAVHAATARAGTSPLAGSGEADRRIDALAPRGESFRFENLIYRFVPASRWKGPGRDLRFRIVKRDDARAIVERMARAPGTSADAQAALNQVSAVLSDAERGIGGGQVYLLRLPPTHAIVSYFEAPSLTPSRLAKLKENHWVEIALVGEDGIGIAGVRYLIVAPDSEEYTGVTDGDGLAKVTNIPAGNSKISFPDLDKDAWKAL